ncbi:hypothetical protein GA0115240_10764 [Streptomyces sp. DvalAA-14]|uniref:hypothetical protein n=1 Tax=unclassified Streptomyces TaxID=2593676 RepID=UPI00081B0766|nr:MULTISPECIES: hypothetical protein [unclassified Streptomyces]MYS19361.1 hypothetical protein [Streptomyces sp. SID4948]SCD42720.1 hypothetical protein GA0115240_10764 [Streptomyces sp. DvalAA-14]
MDKDEERRLSALTPEISRATVDLLRRVVGLEPAERIPEEALATADRVLAERGTDGLRILAMSLTGWAAVLIEQDAKLSGRTFEAVLDDIDLTCLEANAEG